jgi:hypothetical protein
MCANIGVIIGPMIGGLTSDPVSTYPSLFGGITWLEKYPYSPPQVFSAMFLGCAALAVFFGLEEVSSTSVINSLISFRGPWLHLAGVWQGLQCLDCKGIKNDNFSLL